ncbi:MAG: hypothetical protein L0H07_13135, partial [Corynebacterium sp.]|nr:hypothetical protein [Corynebacterium sp.]
MTVTPPTTLNRPDLTPDDPALARRTSRAGRADRPLLRALTHGRGLVGVLLTGTVVLAGLLAPLIAPYAPTSRYPARTCS